MSLALTKITRIKQGSNKKLFNKECKEVSKQFHIASNDRNRFPQNEQLKKEASDLLKQYTKTCNMNREKFSSIQAHSLYNVENSSTGNAWKKCSEKVEEKTPTLKDGEKWENVYKCLFDNNDKRAIACQEKIQIRIK